MTNLFKRNVGFADCRLQYRVQAKSIKVMLAVLGFWLALAGGVRGQNGTIVELGPTDTHDDPSGAHGRGVGIINSVEFSPNWGVGGNAEMLASSPWGGLFYSSDGGENWQNAGTDGMRFPDVGRIRWFKQVVGGVDKQYWLITKADYIGRWWSFCDGIYIVEYTPGQIPSANDWHQIADRRDLGMFWDYDENSPNDFRAGSNDFNFTVTDILLLPDGQGHVAALVGTMLGMFRTPDILDPDLDVDWTKMNVTGQLVMAPDVNSAVTPQYVEIGSIAAAPGTTRIFTNVVLETIQNSNASGPLSQRTYPINIHRQQKAPPTLAKNFEHRMYYSDNGGVDWVLVENGIGQNELVQMLGMDQFVLPTSQVVDFTGIYGVGVFKTTPIDPTHMYFSFVLQNANSTGGKIYRFEVANPETSFEFLHNAIVSTGGQNEGPNPAHSFSLVLSPFKHNDRPIIFQGDVSFGRLDFDAIQNQYVADMTDSPIRADARFSLFEPGIWSENNFRLWTTWDGGLLLRSGSRTTKVWTYQNRGLSVAALSYSHSARSNRNFCVVGTQDCGSSIYNELAVGNRWTKVSYGVNNPFGGDGYYCDLQPNVAPPGVPKFLVTNQGSLVEGMADNPIGAGVSINSGTGAFSYLAPNVRAGMEGTTENSALVVPARLYHLNGAVKTDVVLPQNYRPSSGDFGLVQINGDIIKYRPWSSALFVLATNRIPGTGDFHGILYNTDFDANPNGIWETIPFGSGPNWNCDPTFGSPFYPGYDYLNGPPASSDFVVDEDLTANGKPVLWLLLGGCKVGRDGYGGGVNNDYEAGRWKDRVMYYNGTAWSLYDRSWPAGMDERIIKLEGEPGVMNGLYATTYTRRLYYTNDCMTEWVEVGDRVAPAKSLPHVLAQAMDIYQDADPMKSRLRIGTWGRGLWEMPLAMAYFPQITVTQVSGACNDVALTATVAGLDLNIGSIIGWRRVGFNDNFGTDLSYSPVLEGTFRYEYVYRFNESTWLAGIEVCGRTPEFTRVGQPLLTLVPDCGGGLFRANVQVATGVAPITFPYNWNTDLQNLPGSDLDFGLVTLYKSEGSFQHDGTYQVWANSSDGCTVRGQFSVWGEATAAYDSPDFTGDNFIHSNILVAFDPVAQDNANLYFRGDTRYYGDEEGIGGRVFGTTLTLDVKCHFKVKHNVLFTSHSASCDQMWGGIRVPFGSTNCILDMGGATDSQINHAFTGIRLSSYEPGSDYVVVNHVAFNNCYIGVEYGLNGDKTLAGNELRVINSTFGSVAEEMKRPFDLARVGQYLSSNRFIGQFGIFLNYKVLTNPGMLDNNTFTNLMVGVMTSLGQSQVDNSTFNDVGWLGIGMHDGLPFTPTGSLAQGCHFHFASTSLATPQKAQFVRDGTYFSESAVQSLPSFHYAPLRTTCIGILTNTEYSTQLSDFAVATRNQTGLRYYGLVYADASGPPDLDNNLSNDEDVLSNQFENLDVGIRKYGSGKISIVANTFTQNLRAIELGYNIKGPATGPPKINTDLNMKCNSFIPHILGQTDNVDRIGLLIENGVQVNENAAIPGDIGGGSNYSGPNSLDYPNANYFPIKDGIDRTSLPTQNVQADWAEAGNWKSIVNQSENVVYYWRFSNEFVNNNSNPLPGTITDPSWSQLAHTVNSTTNSVNPCPDYSNFPATIIFPTRIAVDSSGLFTSLLPINNGAVWLASPVPNPAVDLVKVGAYLPETVQTARLQIIEVGTGKVIQSSTILERGKIVIELKISSAPSGTYMYRLFYDGHITTTKKLVVSH